MNAYAAALGVSGMHLLTTDELAEVYRDNRVKALEETNPANVANWDELAVAASNLLLARGEVECIECTGYAGRHIPGECSEA